MAELKLKSDIGVQSAGEKINWRYLNEERVDDPVISALMKEAETTNCVTLPTGRIYKYEPTNRRGELVWPRTTILNYPVQGLGADIMAIARVSLHSRLKRLAIPEIKLVNTVHDSIIIDAPDKYTEQMSRLILDVFEAVPKNFEKLFKVPFNLPMTAEVEFGKDWKNMEKFVA